MNLEELSDNLPDRHTIRRELDHLVGQLPSRDEVRERVSNLPATAKGWLPSRREPAWTDVITARSVAVFSVGMVLGAGLAALLSPRSGPALRRDLIAGVQRLRNAAAGSERTSSKRAPHDDIHDAEERPGLSH